MVTRLATFEIHGIAPFSPSAPFKQGTNSKEDGETYDDVEERIWRERIHRNEQGQCVIPAMMAQFALQDAAKRMGVKVQGRGAKVYTPHFAGGVVVLNDAIIHGVDNQPIDYEKVRGQWLYLNADGIRGSGKRVWKKMPMIDKWSASIEFAILDDIIPVSVFNDTMKFVAIGVGYGRFAPRKGGNNGRFGISKVTWSYEDGSPVRMGKEKPAAEDAPKNTRSAKAKAELAGAEVG